jgi:hypothetical protein
VVSWLDSQQEEFIIKDNVGYGEWDWDILANEWDANQLEDWGLDVWTPEEETEVREKDTEDQKWKLGDHTLQVKEHALPENTTQIAVVIQAWENFTGKKAELVS